MATDNKQKVLIRSMSTEELENYLCNSDINGKIIPKNEDTWHQNYDRVNIQYYEEHTHATISTNKNHLDNYEVFTNRIIGGDTIIKANINRSSELIDKTFEHVVITGGYSSKFKSVTTFRPLIEYKE